MTNSDTISCDPMTANEASEIIGELLASSPTYMKAFYRLIEEAKIEACKSLTSREKKEILAILRVSGVIDESVVAVPKSRRRQRKDN